MSEKEIMLVCMAVLGLILFLYGSNYYNATAGWAGICLIIGGFFAEVILKIYAYIKVEKRREGC